MTRFALEDPLAGLPLIIDLVDVDSLKWNALAARATGPMRWVYEREAKYLSRFEARAARRAFATLVVNERERTALATIAPDAKIEVVPNGVDYEYFHARSGPSAEPEVVFCGVMDYGPNEEAAVWLGREVWPLVRERRGDVRLRVVGSRPRARVRNLAARDATIEITGDVPDVRPYLWRAAVATAPLHTARGVQNKVLEAVAAGVPAVVTPEVAGGLPPEVLIACRIAADPRAFADAVLEYLQLSPDQRRGIAESTNLADLSWSSRLATLGDLLQEAVRHSAL
jgi:glycosyltransferase involved in cell wall biosynthesis